MSEQDKAKKPAVKKTAKKSAGPSSSSAKKPSAKKPSVKPGAQEKSKPSAGEPSAAERAAREQVEREQAQETREEQERQRAREEAVRRQDEADMALGALLGHAQAGFDEACAAARAAGQVAKLSFEEWKVDAKRDLRDFKAEAKKFVDQNPALSAAIATVASTVVVASVLKAFRRKK